MYSIQINNTIICSDRFLLTPGPDFVPSYTKQEYIRVPYVFKSRPVVSATISSDAYIKKDGTKAEAAPVAFVLIAVEADNPYPTETLFKVSAENLEIGKDVLYPYWCDFMVMGELADANV
jgi:hypothetical protein